MIRKLISEVPCIGTGNVILRKVTLAEKESLKKMTCNPHVYRYLPAFLYKKKYEDIEYVINHLYDEDSNDSFITGIYFKDDFCGLEEIYGFRDDDHKISIGYRLMEEYWGLGIATEALRLMTEYLFKNTDIELITASVLPENKASARVLEKNGFDLIEQNVPEDWGFDKPLPTDKWIKRLIYQKDDL